MKNKTDRTRKPLKKAALKSIIALVLCMATIIGSIGAGANTASAAKKKVPLAVTFKGKKVNLIADLTTFKTAENRTTFSKVQKKWGKPNKKSSIGSNPAPTWKKGKSKISLGDYGYKNGKIGGISIEIKDTNASVFGVKVGMKKAQAIKKIENTTGWKVKSHTRDGKKFLCAARKHHDYNDDKGYYCGNFSVSFYYKNEKISEIEFGCL